MKAQIIAAATAVLATASFASADKFNPPLFPNDISGATPSVSGPRGTLETIDFSGVESWDVFGSGNNTVILFDVAAALGAAPGTESYVEGIGFEGFIETFNVGTLGGSWVSEVTISFDNSTGDSPDAIFLTPGVGIDEPSYETPPDPDPVSTGGIINLIGIGFENIVLPDGILRIEIFESFDDEADAMDGRFTEVSTLTLDLSVIPEPTSLALLGLGGLTLLRRRRA